MGERVFETMGRKKEMGILHSGGLQMWKMWTSQRVDRESRSPGIIRKPAVGSIALARGMDCESS